jgi:hypothetical protein
MKYLLPFLIVLSGCATQRSAAPVAASAVKAKAPAGVRTSETVKAYPVGRYTDPGFPEEMHERHTVYRREQSASWNYQPSEPYALPLGPVVARSNPSPSYYAKTNAEQISAQQKAYADALLEQNTVLKKRIDTLQQEKATIQKLESENEKLRLELESKNTQPKPSPAPSGQDDPLGEFGFSDPGEIMLFPESEDDYQAFLISQMRLHDELTAELASLERSRLQTILNPLRFPRGYLASALFLSSP